jgi:hypothetical protein
MPGLSALQTQVKLALPASHARTREGRLTGPVGGNTR